MVHGTASESAATGRSILAQHGWLANVPADFRQAVLQQAIFRQVAAGTEFVHAGDRHHGLIGIVSGVAEVSLLRGHPNTRAMHLVYRGFWAGYRTLIDRPLYIRLVARTPVDWALVPLLALRRLLAEQPEWWRHMLALADDNSVAALNTAGDLTIRNSRARVAALLLRLAGCRYSDPPAGMEPEVRMSQSDLGAMAVMARNSFNIILAALQADGLVETSYGSIVLKRPDALRTIAAEEE